MSNTFRRIGTGPHPVIGLHGWFGDCHAFAPMEEAFSVDEFTYVFMNYRGYGSMHSATGYYSMDEIAADTLSLASDLGFDTFSLIGHSMGGMAIERVAAVAPERVRMLVAVAPVPSCGVAFDEAGRLLFSGAVENIENRKIIIDRSTGQRLPRAWIDRKAGYSMAHSSRAAFAGYLQAWSNANLGAAAQGLPHRVKVLVGEYDPKFNAELMRSTYLECYTRVDLEILANAGHYPMDEVPLALAATIERFLRQT